MGDFALPQVKYDAAIPKIRRTREDSPHAHFVARPDDSRRHFAPGESALRARPGLFRGNDTDAAARLGDICQRIDDEHHYVNRLILATEPKGDVNA
jgi:hypothetical protein